jgi:hypothetical protein
MAEVFIGSGVGGSLADIIMISGIETGYDP